MATIENFLLRFKVDGQQAIDKASSSVKNLSSEVQNFGANLGPVGNGLGTLLGRLGPVGAAAGAAGLAFAALGLRAIQLADEIADISDATNISAGALLNFKQSVLEAGGGAGDFQQLAVKLNQTIGEAAEGSDKAQKAFKTLGVFVTDAGGSVRSTEVILRDAIAKLAAIEDPSTRAALAVDLFGKAAAKLDLTKLNAMRDPVADADIKRLAEYQAAIDRVRNSLERGIITFFGSAAKQAEDFFERTGRKSKQMREEAAERGFLIENDPFTGFPRERKMTAQQRAAYAESKRIAEMERLMAPAAGKPRWQEISAPGGFGKTSEAEQKANAKALADWELRLQNSVNQTKLQEELRSANTIQTVSLNAAAELERAKIEIYGRERLSKEQKDHEFAEKEVEISAKAANEIARLRMQANAKAFAEEEAQREANRQAIAEYEKATEKATETARLQSESYKESVTSLENQIMLERELLGMNDIMANGQRQIAQEVARRTKALQDLAKIENLTYEERLKREAQINEQSQRAIELLRERAREEYERSQNFQIGWKEAFDKYIEDAYKASEAAKTYFNSFTKGLEDAFVSLFTNAKFSWKGFINGLIADFARIEFRKMLSALSGTADGKGSILMTLFNWGKSFFGRADGGSVNNNTPYIVGERGPELFVPNGSGKIVPNEQLGRAYEQRPMQITYNINAVDAASFRALVARDPSFIYAVTEQGRRSQPSRRTM